MFVICTLQIFLSLIFFNTSNPENKEEGLPNQFEQEYVVKIIPQNDSALQLTLKNDEEGSKNSVQRLICKEKNTRGEDVYWRIIKMGNSKGMTFYKILHKNWYMAIESNSKIEADVKLWVINKNQPVMATPHKIWRFSENTDGSYNIISGKNNECITNDLNIRLGKKRDLPVSRWYFIDRDGKQAKIK